MEKLKVSWTILSTWSKGDRDTAIQMIAGIPTPTNKYMERGKELHNIVSVNRLKLIPEISDTAIFEDIRPEEKVWVNYFKVSINEWLDLSLVVDVLDTQNKLIIDWKASSRRSTEHNKLQIYLYALAMKLEGYDIEHGIFATIDKDKQHDAVYCKEYSQFKIDEEKLLLAENYIETIGGEIYQFLNDKNEKE